VVRNVIDIAIVEDDEAVRDSIQLVLSDFGWRVRTYSGGEDFLADLDDYVPDCLILDPHLPGLSGADVARALAVRNARVAIVGLTARPTSVLAGAVLAAGASAMMTKPVTVEALVNQVLAALAGRGR
jgi:two-component system response regulator TtrR